ncbi:MULTISPECIES: hypothetical protein [Desulfovibrio]|uniref:Uncharacterized protein n=1 Tax=Desulfovibrio desulfuricans TaxID=876 RepID=A0AA94HQP9_DESDE|nr:MULTISPECIES: hypothetical protein [Desulfovibrio]SFW18818.1 hypothetical protein SAMN02910291_00322 [Desulfovibrio desulfuricans]SPD34362.1 Hypothetical protein DSVG11_0236 [Desulfovibrio sp. G11]
MSVAYGRSHIKDGRGDGKNTYKPQAGPQAGWRQRGQQAAYSQGGRGKQQKRHGELAGTDKAALYHTRAADIVTAIHAKDMVKQVIGKIGDGQAQKAAQQKQGVYQPLAGSNLPLEAKGKGQGQGDGYGRGDEKRRAAGLPPCLEMPGSREPRGIGGPPLPGSPQQIAVIHDYAFSIFQQ